jgi:hypothetical protein
MKKSINTSSEAEETSNSTDEENVGLLSEVFIVKDGTSSLGASIFNLTNVSIHTFL